MTSIQYPFEVAEAEGPVPSDVADVRDVREAGGPSHRARKSVAQRLNLAVFGNTIVLALLALIMLGGTYKLGQDVQAQAVIGSVEVRANNSAIALVDVIDGLEAARDAENPAARGRAIAQAEIALERAEQNLTDPDQLADEKMPANVRQLVIGFRSAIQDLRGAVGEDLASDVTITAQLRESRRLFSDLSAFALNYHAVVAEGADTLFANISLFLIVVVVLTLIGISGSLVGARRIVSDVVGMIRTITDAMEQVAAGRTETAIPGHERHDEIGAMARALAVFRQDSLDLRDLNARRVEEAEERLAQQQLLSQQMQDLRKDKSLLLEDMASAFEVSVGEVITAVSAASQQLKATSNQMVSLAEDSNGQANKATAAMEKATANVTAAAAATDEFALSISEISRQASSSAELARTATEQVSTANTRMSDLSKAALEVGEIVGLIQTIAQRTNLLALNASIEAARGGEAGRGFAVVASEVKELAMQTSRATNSVTEKITAMQDSTRSSADDLNAIVEQIGELEQVAVMIASAVDQQSVSGEELARNIDTVAVGSAQVGERLAALRAASEETGDAADDVVASANALGAHADDLRTKAGRFIEDVRRSARELQSGKAA